MVEQSRLEDLRRRVQRDPASIAFAQLAEEYRRGGQYAESVETCRIGLALHPGYLSARVTLGRALIELGELADAQSELEIVLKTAPENLAAIRGLADILHKHGDLAGALAQYKTALALARNDPDLEETVNDLTRQLAPTRGRDPKDGLSLEQMHSVFAQHVPPPPIAPAQVPIPVPVQEPAHEAPTVVPDALIVMPEALPAAPEAPTVVSEALIVVPAPPTVVPEAQAVVPEAANVAPGVPVEVETPDVDPVVAAPDPDPTPNPSRTRAVLQIDALEQWLTAVHAARTERRA